MSKFNIEGTRKYKMIEIYREEFSDCGPVVQNEYHHNETYGRHFRKLLTNCDKNETFWQIIDKS